MTDAHGQALRSCSRKSWLRLTVICNIPSCAAESQAHACMKVSMASVGGNICRERQCRGVGQQGRVACLVAGAKAVLEVDGGAYAA